MAASAETGDALRSDTCSTTASLEAGWDAGLDDAQLAAATHGDGPLIIAAGAGTGKTRTLVARLAALIERGVDPSRILLLTFTRRAADEMLTRAAAVAHRRDAARRLTGGTFHAVAHRDVAAHAPSLGLSPNLSVLDTADARDVFELLRQDLGLAQGRDRSPRADTLADIYSRAVNTGRPASEVIARQFPWCEPHLTGILDVFRGYVARKRAQSLLDFDDLLLNWRALLSDPALGPALAGRYDHVLVDEYQDVNQIQVDIVRRLCPDGVGLTVVGDDAQAIYGFRGADSRHLLQPGRRVARGHGDRAGAQLPVPAAHPGAGQRGPAGLRRRPAAAALRPRRWATTPAGALS